MFEKPLLKLANFQKKYPDHEFSKGIWDIAENVFGLRPKAHLEIMHDLLLDISEGKMVSRKVSALYIDKLLSEGFIKGKGKEKYIITDKGKRFLKKYKTIRKFVDNFRL